MKFLDERTYCYDPSSSVWIRQDGADDLAFTDGRSIEERMYRIVNKLKDKSIGSDELLAHNEEWAFEYHLSPVRGNLLMPFCFEGLDVLEIGAGCGALTRMLGDKQAQVLALEGGFPRSKIIAERCRDLKNVTVVCEKFERFDSKSYFDVVVAVGVLEWAPKFYASEDPVQDFLAKARKFLKPEGVLILATENQLGLKYFSGCSEDHMGVPFYGIQDRYNPHTDPITFGRQELVHRLHKADFAHVKFFYPIPDYKLPKIIFSEEGIRHPLLDAGGIISEYRTRDYMRQRIHLFSEQMVWPVLQRNGLVEDFANSFLVFCSAAPMTGPPAEVNWLAVALASERAKGFRTTTTFTDRDTKVIVTKKKTFGNDSRTASCVVRMRDEPSREFVSGPTLQYLAARACMSAEAGIDEIAKILEPWVQYLRNQGQPAANGSRSNKMPAWLIDCTPWNLICTSHDPSSFVVTDLEWQYLLPLDIKHVIFRGLLFMNLQIVNSTVLRESTVRNAMLALFDRLGFQMSQGDLEHLLAAETDFQAAIIPVAREKLRGTILSILTQPFLQGTTLDEICRIQDAKIASIVNSRSWKITAPLRWLGAKFGISN